MKKIIDRLKSPVVIIQLITILSSVIVALEPNTAEAVDNIVYAITIIVNVFAGVNNPSDKEAF